MNIVCPNCTTFFAIDPARLGPAGRMVRCARCKHVWMARPEPAPPPENTAPAFASVGAGLADAEPDALEWHDPGPQPDLPRAETPLIDSPSIVTDLPASRASGNDVTEPAPDAALREPRRGSWMRWRAERRRGRARRRLSLLAALCLAMAALAAALIVWRSDVVRLLPQTAAFYRLIGLDVNLRGLRLRDVRLSTEVVDGKLVLVIEGHIAGTAPQAVDLPRLRLVLRDRKGTEIYAWNTVLDQAVLKPGETISFRSRLAAPPADAHRVDVRFFNRLDLAAGHG